MSQDPPDGSEQRPGARLRPISAAAVTGWAVTGLVGGWLLRRAILAGEGTAPLVTWLQVAIPFFVAAILAAVARTTWTAIHRRHELLDPSRAVNRLVLARACALVGALVAGGYLGYAVSWLGLEAELAGQRAVRSALASLGGVAMTVAAVFLERACRVRSDDEAA